MLILLQIALLSILLAMSAFFSGSETAFFSLSRFDIRRMTAKGLPRAGNVAALLKRPSRLLVAILVGNMVVNVAATTLITGIFLKILGPGGVAVAVVFMTALILIFGEITPKVLAVEHNELWARLGSGPVGIVLFITAPLRILLQGIQTLVLGREAQGDTRLGEVDLSSALELAHREGAIEGRSRDLLSHFLSLESISAREIMIPRVKVPIVSPAATPAQALERLAEMSIDFGIVENRQDNTLDILEKERLVFAGDADTVREVARRPVFIPQNKTLASLYLDFYHKRNRHVVVVDEHGDFLGIIEREKVLAAIFAAPLSKARLDTSHLSRIGESYVVSGDMPLEEFNGVFGAELSSDHYSTIGGYLVEMFGKVPLSGESKECERFCFRVIGGDARKIERIAVKRVE